jgi:glycosyltransferase 2 family protein
MVIREIPASDYSSFIQRHPSRTVFHRVAWLEAAARVYGSKIHYLGLFAGDALQGVCPVFEQRRFAFRLYGCPLPGHATPRLQPLIPDDRREEALVAFHRWVKENRISHFQLCWSDPRVRLPRGPRAEALKNLEIQLGSTVEATWKQIRPKARNEIRYAAHRHGVRIHWIRDNAFLAEYWRLLESTYTQRQGIAPNFPLKLYRELLKAREALNLRVVAATQRGKTVAAAWILFDNERCYWWDGASDYDQRKLSANHLLQWEMLRWCTKRGFKVYDMVGFGGRVKSGSGARPGITRFKESLGARAADYAVLYWQTGFLRIALASYRRMRRISDSLERAWKSFMDLTPIRSKKIRKMVRWGLALAVFYFVGRYVAANVHAIGNVGAPRPGWLITACLTGILSYLVHPYALKALIEAHGSVVPYSTALGLCYLPWLGKYVPGKIWSIIAGLYLFSKEGISQHVAATCLMLFTSLNIAAGLLITLAFGVPESIDFLGIWPMVGLALAILLCTSPRILYPAMNRILRWAQHPEIDARLTPWGLYRVLLIMVTSNVIYGLGFACLVRSLAAFPSGETPHLVGLMALGEVSGFLALFAPAGIGVREGILMAGLTPLVGAGPAIVISGAARVWGTVLEFITIGLGWIALRFFGSEHPISDPVANLKSAGDKRQST